MDDSRKKLGLNEPEPSWVDVFGAVVFNWSCVAVAFLAAVFLLLAVIQMTRLTFEPLL